MRLFFIVLMMFYFTMPTLSGEDCLTIDDKIERAICLLVDIKTKVDTWEHRIAKLEFYVYIIGGTVGLTVIAIIKDFLSRYITTKMNGNHKYSQSPFETPRKR